MAIYSAKEMKEKLNGKTKVRELEIKESKQIKIWIPKNEFIIVKKHFNIQTVPTFKNAIVRAINCINSDSNVGTCPVCDHIKSLWDTWRSTTDKNEKQKIQNTINRLNTTFYYINAIDISDKTYKCMALRLTSAMFKAISDVINPDEGDEVEISHVLWTVKKTTNNSITRYAIVEDVENETALKLSKNIDKICNRDEKDGGYIDLEKAYSQTFTQTEYMHKLYGCDDSDSETEEEPVTTKSKVKVIDEDVSLDDIEDEEPVKKPSKPAKTEELDDDLDLDSENEEPVKKPSKPAKTEELDDDLDLDSEEAPFETDDKPAKKKPRNIDDIDDNDFDLELDEEPAKKPSKPVESKKPSKQEIDDDDDLELEDIEI